MGHSDCQSQAQAQAQAPFKAGSQLQKHEQQELPEQPKLQQQTLSAASPLGSESTLSPQSPDEKARVSSAFGVDTADEAQPKPEKPTSVFKAIPLLLKKPRVASREESERLTIEVCQTLEQLIAAAPGIHVRIGDNARRSAEARALLEAASDEEGDQENAPIVVSLARDTLHTIPRVEMPQQAPTENRLFIYVGTPNKYFCMSTKSKGECFDRAFQEDRLVVLCRGTCMLPVEGQEQSMFGIDEKAVLRTICRSVTAKGKLTWAHGAKSKANLLASVYSTLAPQAMPKALSYAGDAAEKPHFMDYLKDYVRYLNEVKMAMPELLVQNYYDTGLLVTVLTNAIASAGCSLLTDCDGLQMLREGSIGHIISKLNQTVTTDPHRQTKAIRNFFIGDGACRLNGGMELTMHLIKNYQAKSMTTLFVFNNEKWAIEDNLVNTDLDEHQLHNKDFYDLLGEHQNVTMCNTDEDLRDAVVRLSERAEKYTKGEAEAALNIVVVRSCDVNVPCLLGSTEALKKSPEIAMMREVLGKFAEGCEHTVPIYGCSAMEYIVQLQLFLEEMPEGKKFQYVAGRTDIQAAHMCGMQQPEGKCVLMINDVYGLHGLGESLRAITAEFEEKQCLIMIWHPAMTGTLDRFHSHRPPLVWTNVGAESIKHYVRKEQDALFVDFAGERSSAKVCGEVDAALKAGTPLVVVNVLPIQEQEH